MIPRIYKEINAIEKQNKNNHRRHNEKWTEDEFSTLKASKSMNKWGDIATSPQVFEMLIRPFRLAVHPTWNSVKNTKYEHWREWEEKVILTPCC